MPIKAQCLDHFIAPSPPSQEAPPLGIQRSSHHFTRHDQQEDHPDAHMGAMEAGDQKESRAELCRPPWVAPGPDAFMDELGPLEGLHPDKGNTENGRHGM